MHGKTHIATFRVSVNDSVCRFEAQKVLAFEVHWSQGSKASFDLGGHTLPSCQKNGGIHWAGFGSGEEGSTRLLVHDMATA